MPVAIYALALAAFAVGVQSYVFIGLLTPLAADLEVSVAVAGQLATAYTIASALAAPVVVSALAGLKRRRVLVLALGVLGAINLATSLSPNFETLLAARVALALVSALVIPMAGAIAASLVSENRQGAALGLILPGLTLAFVVGVPVGAVIGDAYGWRATFVFASVAAWSVIPAVFWATPRSPGTKRASASVFDLTRRPIIALALALSGLAFIAAYPVFAFIGPVVETATGVTGAGIGGMQALIGVGSILGIALGAWRADRRAFLRSALALFASLIAIQGTYSLWFSLNGSGALRMAAPLGLSLIASATVLFALGPVIEKALVRAAPEQAALTLALNTSMTYGGQGLGAALGGATIAIHGLGALGLVGGAIAAVGFALIVFTSPFASKERAS